MLPQSEEATVFLSTAGKRGAVQNSCSTCAETAGNEEGQSNRSSTRGREETDIDIALLFSMGRGWLGCYIIRGREETDIDIALLFSMGRGWLGCYIIRGSSLSLWRPRASSLHGFHVAGVYLQVFNGLFSLQKIFHE